VQPKKKLYVSYYITNNYANPITIKTNSSLHPVLPSVQPGGTIKIQLPLSATLAIRVFDALTGQLQRINGQTVVYIKPTEDVNSHVRLYVPYRITGNDYVQYTLKTIFHNSPFWPIMKHRMKLLLASTSLFLR
jgi:hypothetical protein